MCIAHFGIIENAQAKILAYFRLLGNMFYCVN